MRKFMEHKREFSFLFFAMLLASFLMIQCGEEVTESATCLVHEDCPVGFSCIESLQVCGTDINAFQCMKDSDCIKGYACFIDPTTAEGKCVPSAVTPDGDEEQESNCTSCTIGGGQCNVDTETCYEGCCTLINAPCPNGVSDCMNGQICVMENGTYICAYEEDGDKPDGDTVVDGDLDKDADPEPETTPSCTNGACDTTDQCSDGKVCGAGGCCVDSCTVTGCTYGTCNPNNGLCEYCETTCGEGKCCNYHESFWYCGSCCTPPCGDGQACMSGTCQDLVCPTCSGTNCTCGPQTGYHCECEEEDGDVDRVGDTCLPANAACTEGVDDCCSGTCLMGTCL